jgi:hypothetical protein
MSPSKSKTKKKSNFSKRKGSAFERNCCKKLSLWLSDGKEEDLLWRSSISGGRSTVGLKSGKTLSNQAGDISAVSPKGHLLTNRFLIECKSYKDLELWKLFYGDKGVIAGFWKKLLIDSKKYDKEPMLIVKQNTQKVLIILGWQAHDSMFIDDNYFNHITIDPENISNDMFIGDFDKFLETTEVKTLDEEWRWKKLE